MNDPFFFEREFELRFLKSRGNAFQDLFSEVMEKAYPGDFQRIRPHGNMGDLKCDGYLTSQRTVFQVYAPEDIRSLQRLLRKIREDFTEAVQHWTGRIDRWVFVHNSQTGLPAQAKQLLDDLGKQVSAPKVESWGYEELRLVLYQLGADALRALFRESLGQVHTPPTHRLPQPAAAEQYWIWVCTSLKCPTPQLDVFKTLGLPIRLITPEKANELRAIEEHAAGWKSRETRIREVQHSNGLEKTTGWETTDLLHALRVNHRLLITGDSGSGKSTLLQRFARAQAKRLYNRGFARARGHTPVLIELWRFTPDRSLLDMIVSGVRGSGARISRDELLTTLERGYLILLLDGLDDVPHRYRRECLAQIIDLAEEYCHAPIVLTSRLFPTPPRLFHQLAIAPLANSDIAGALGSCFGSRQAFREKFAGHLPEEYLTSVLHPEVIQLCRSPFALGLVLTLLANNSRLPETLYGMYDRFLSWLLDWEVQNGRLSSAAAAIVALEKTAYAMEKQDQVYLQSTDWIRIAVGDAVHESCAEVTAQESLEEVLRDLLSTGLLRTQEGVVSFSHRSLLDFLAARRILSKLASILAHTDPVALHTGVARFLCGSMQDVVALLEEHLLHCNDVEELMPLLQEASRTGGHGGHFEALYRAIIFGQEMGVDISYSLSGPEEETFIHDIDELVQTALDFKPKALSILKNATYGIVVATQWESSRLWFERIVDGLEAYDWPGASSHRHFAEIGVFENMDAFVDDGTDLRAADRVEALFAYLGAVHGDDFPRASKYLAQIENLLIQFRQQN